MRVYTEAEQERLKDQIKILKNQIYFAGLSFIIIFVFIAISFISANSKINLKYNKLYSEYSNLKSDHNKLYSEYSKLNSEYGKLNSEYSHLNFEYSHLNSGYNGLANAVLEEKLLNNMIGGKHSKLISDYNDLANKVLELEEKLSKSSMLSKYINYENSTPIFENSKSSNDLKNILKEKLSKSSISFYRSLNEYSSRLNSFLSELT